MPLVVGDLLEKAAFVAPDRVAATLGDRAICYGQLQNCANQIANALAGVKVRRGDRCMVWGDTSLAYVELFAGLTRCGAVFVPVVSTLTVDELIPLAEYIRPSFVIADVAHAEQAQCVADHLAAPLLVFAVGDLAKALPGKVLDRLSTNAKADHFTGYGPGESDLHAIFLTSGSTGRPKGVMLSHRTNWLRVYAGVGPHMPSGGAGMVNMFPLTHFAGWHFVTLMWSRLRAIHLVERADANLLQDAVQRWRANELYCIPAVWRRILAEDEKKFDLSSLQSANTGTSLVLPELLAAIKTRLPHTSSSVSYGATEVPTIAVLRDEDLFDHPGSVGLPAPGCAVRIADDGEVCVQSDLVMQGYFDRPRETTEAIQHGWYHTGDVGELQSGYLSLHGRKREIIRSGGETVVPVEVEILVSDYPGVREVAVVGVTDTDWGEIVTACLVMEPGKSAPDVKMMRTFLQGKLAPYKHPRRIEQLDAIPRTNATGQVRRKLLQEQFAADPP